LAPTTLVTEAEPRENLLRRPRFLAYLACRFLFNLVARMQEVGIGWYVYSLTGDPLHLGYVGLSMFLPALLLGLVAGDFADRFNRGVILTIAYVIAATATACLTILVASGMHEVWPVYALAASFSAAMAFVRPSLWATIAQAVPRPALPRAIAITSVVSQSAVIIGPAAGGLLLLAGTAFAFGTAAGLCLVCAAISLLFLTRGALPQVIDRRGESTVRRMLAGIAFIIRTPVMLGVMTADLFAVLLGSVVVLLPVYASDILDAGPAGLGLLRSSPAIGSVMAAIAMTRFAPRRHAGRLMLTFTGLFGVAGVIFGLSQSLIISILALVAMGASDMVSVVIRQSITQLGTPDSMRGRVNAVSQIFIAGSNELGDFRAGLIASLIGPFAATVIGGLSAIGVAIACAIAFPAVRRLDDPSDAAPPDEAAADEAASVAARA
jgi:MFS family permease